jgi:hypothetical protein
MRYTKVTKLFHRTIGLIERDLQALERAIPPEGRINAESARVLQGYAKLLKQLRESEREAQAARKAAKAAKVKDLTDEDLEARIVAEAGKKA